MADYAIVFTRAARKDLENYEKFLNDRITSKIGLLARNPRPQGCRKMQSEQDLWRIRIGDYRVIYSIDDDEQIVEVIHVRHRKDAYR